MLTVEQKLMIFDSFNELTKKIRKDQIRVDYFLPKSQKRQKNVISEFNLTTGNGYVCGKYFEPGHKYDLDNRGWVKINNFSEEVLKEVIYRSIQSLSK